MNRIERASSGPGRPRTPWRYAAALATVVLLAGCMDSESPTVSSAPPAPPGPAPSTTPTTATTSPPRSTTTTAAPPSSVAPPQTSDRTADYRPALARMVADIRSWWTAQMPTLYKKPYQDLQGGLIAATPQTANIPSCGATGGRNTGYRAVQGNAFYCPQGDFIAYDDAQLFPGLAKTFGPISVGLVLAHEWGHAVQDRAGVDGPTIRLEQQADCFAGAWLAHVEKDRPSGVSLAADDLTAAIGGFLGYSDPVGTTASTQGAHGSGFDRVGALQDGYLNGGARCVQYATNPPPVLELPFTSRAEQQAGGNAPYDQVIPDVTADLDRYWGTAQPGFTPLASTVAADTTAAKCNGQTVKAPSGRVQWCKQEVAVVYDPTYTRSVYREGDFAEGVLFGHAWSEAALDRSKSKLAGRDRVLAADCLTGAWTRSLIAQLGENKDPKRTISLSPGDLDETISTLVAQGATLGADARAASTWDRVAAYRDGVTGGRSACKA